MKLTELRKIIKEEIAAVLAEQDAPAKETIRKKTTEMLTLGGDTSSLSSEKHYLDYTKDEINKMSLEDAIKLYKKAKQGWSVPATWKVKEYLIDRIKELKPEYFLDKKTNKKLSETEAPEKIGRAHV